MNEQWIETAQNWPITAKPRYQHGDEAYIAAGGYIYGYFSPYRPLNFVFGVDCVLVRSTEEHHDFIFTKAPLDERACKWELLPYTEAASASMFGSQAQDGG